MGPCIQPTYWAHAIASITPRTPFTPHLLQVELVFSREQALLLGGLRVMRTTARSPSLQSATVNRDGPSLSPHPLCTKPLKSVESSPGLSTASTAPPDVPQAGRFCASRRSAFDMPLQHSKGKFGIQTTKPRPPPPTTTSGRQRGLGVGN